jgi:hypothetical protein
MGDEISPKPVDKLAGDIIKDDVKKQGESGKPGKNGQHAALRKAAVPALAGLALVAAATTVYFTVGNNPSSPSPAPTSTGAPAAPVPSAPQPGVPASTIPPAPSGVAVDQCLVGQWVLTAYSGQPGLSGLTGVLLTFDENGVEAIDYSKAAPQHSTGGSFWEDHTFRGTASAHVNTGGGRTQRLDTIQNSVTETILRNDGYTSRRPVMLGLAFLSGVNPTYTCTPNELSFQMVGNAMSFTYKRVGGQTRSRP